MEFQTYIQSHLKSIDKDCHAATVLLRLSIIIFSFVTSTVPVSWLLIYAFTLANNSSKFAFQSCFVINKLVYLLLHS